MSSRYKWLTCAALLCAVLLRLNGLRGDLWLDEIWSLKLLDHVPGFSGIFTDIKLDNNHLLNSIWLFLAGKGAAAWKLRLPAFIFACLSVFILPFLNFKLAPAERLLWITFVAFSYPLVLFSTEARGYSSLVFFSLLALYFWLKDKPSVAVLAGFYAAVFLGLLSHFTFIQIYLAFLLTDLALLFQKRALKVFAAKHALPMAGLIAFYVLYLRDLPPGGGLIHSYLDTIVNCAGALVGGPLLSTANLDLGVWALFWAFVVLSALLIGQYLLFKSKDARAVFCFNAVFVSPLLFLLGAAPRVLFERYFTCLFPLVYLILSFFVVKLYQQTKIGRALAIVLVAGFLAGSIGYHHRFSKYQRGGYEAAIAQILAGSKARPVVVTGDQEFRDRMLLDYYLNARGEKGQILYAGPKDLAALRPQWYLAQSQDLEYEAPKTITLAGKQDFQLEKVFPFAGLSGWSWFLYRKAAAAAVDLPGHS